ncbi:MerR family transcriptional regulator [Pinisolibacter aquiterrae]|uniref:MerR family transcriptional regulator n=1 Tax=Pinisolibacter aquiterrae TaxID=2815579 RepID=UPI001C3E2F46|nr:MerR family transcriptional regulator [Pinisolibacter aquiterrae]
MDKSPDAFRTISEVAGDLDLPQHVLRFWETRFNQIRPLKRGGGRRYYRPDDVDLLKGIRHLLYGEGYTIRGVQRILKEQGVRFVMDVWREGAPQPARGGERDPAEEAEASGAAPRHRYDPVAYEAPAAPAPEGTWDEAAYDGEPDAPFLDTETADGRVEPAVTAPPVDPEIRAAHVLAQRFAPRGPVASDPRASVRVEPPALTPPPAAAPAAAETMRAGLGHLLDRLRPNAPMSMATPVLAPVAAPPSPPVAASGEASGLSRDDVRRLQATLFELLECKRLLDQVR